MAVADHQTAGRGRLDRRWESPPGANLLASVLLRPRLRRRRRCTSAPARWRWRQPTPVARSAGVEPVLKWPNDLLVGEAKLAGVLAEAEFARRRRWPRSWSGSGSTSPGRARRSGGHLPGRPAARRRSRSTGRVLLDALLAGLAGAARRCSTSRAGRRRAGRRGAPALRHARPAGAGHPGRRGVRRAGASAIDDAGHLVVETAGGQPRRDGRRRRAPASGLTRLRGGGPWGLGLTSPALCAFS